MNGGITFCITKICPYKYTCNRHIENNPEVEDEQSISMTDFEHTNIECRYYIKKEK